MNNDEKLSKEAEATVGMFETTEEMLGEQTQLRFNPSYLKTASGAIKLGAIGLNMIVIICCFASQWWAPLVWTFIVSITAHCASLALLVLNLSNFAEKFPAMPMIEGAICSVWSFFYFTAAVENAVMA